MFKQDWTAKDCRSYLGSEGDTPCHSTQHDDSAVIRGLPIRTLGGVRARRWANYEKGTLRRWPPQEGK